jgi:MFS family permease
VTPADTTRSPILTRQMLLMLAVVVGAEASFYLLLSVVPLYAATAGAHSWGAGLCTGAIMVSTVLTELAVPRLLARHGYRTVMAAGVCLLGLPALALLATPALPFVLAVCLLRGTGLGIVVVLGTSLAAELAPAGRRGEGLGMYGAVVGIPAIVGLPLGVWLSDRAGFHPVFLVGAVVALAALAAVPGLPSRRAQLGGHGGVIGSLRLGALARPTIIFGAVTFAAGVLVTFLPLAVLGAAHELAALALLLQACMAPPARWVAGWLGDRRGARRLLAPAVLISAVGFAGLVWTANPAAVIGGAALFGIGFGLAQNVTLAMMFERVPTSGHARVSALWNLAYDGGMGIGAVSFGALAGLTGYPAGFALTALIVAIALVPAWRDIRKIADPRDHASIASDPFE